VLRSLVALVYLVVSILVSYLAALGATTLLVIVLGGQDGLVFILPFLMFVVLLGRWNWWPSRLSRRPPPPSARSHAAGLLPGGD
jgi:uncharacterized membrane protein YdfJ with MMPL/SSD domain